ncbi:MAG TPA: hypothetical protein VH351_03770 [Bryobacteraceae bacterium]|jgi:hypothetical protein|nr:hypothetical protein [Bryobacteraceae bacterium]
MPNTVDAYREAKMTYMRLRDQAKKDLLAQFYQLSNQLFQIQKELRDDFGHKVAIPSKPKTKRAKKVTAPGPKPVEAKPVEVKTSPKITAIEKKIALQSRKLQEMVSTGKPTQAIKDKLYELEDELRLARGD